MRFLQVIPKLAILSNAEVLSMVQAAQDKGKIKVKGAIEDPELAATLLEEFDVAFFDLRLPGPNMCGNPCGVSR